ncbi:PilW family protein [Cellulomonas bogoriensis]|uniref:Prepilin-type N-terminal cleavage/methylation domain-containing protein n=1 Tax=Cellulomonas bogoriensis 69B4 = DSM 16987 TaxID=1386082 RepID=A0A0A0C4K6_9CELL|nr:prepilin-type N-terminal cleavage/methylation domain-containing protein [Cellulomonas bogoriensis]KGM14259.1 hypothetical protein N869_00745 [Cellulomonas bogoriensis 69B4 = DSM 16987]
MNAAIARLRREDAGFGLPELLISIFLFSVVTALVLTLVTNFSRSFTRERSAVDSTNTAAIGMNELTRVIRSGTEIRQDGTDNLPVLLEARPDDITLHAFLDTDSMNPRPIKVRFRIDENRQLIEERWNADAGSAPYWTFGSPTRPPDSSRPVARQIPEDSPALFRYRSSTVCAPASPNCNVLAPPAGGALNLNARQQVAVIEIRLNVQADPTGRAAPVTIENQVGLPNLGIDRVGAAL